jgi:ABC-2 type transport system permease protein
MSAGVTYLKFELLRTLRNRRFSILSLVFPVIMYFLIAAPNKNNDDLGKLGIFAPQYYMVGLLGFGAMIAGLSAGARIAAERQVGWNRQLRLTPLSPRDYFRAKVVLLSIAGLILGVRIPADQWLRMCAMVLVAAVPFAALGIGLGHLLTTDAMGPATGFGTALFAFLGGTWFPITGSGAFVTFCKLLPSYWLVQAGQIGNNGSTNPWGTEGWIVIAVWIGATVALARWAYRRDTKR